MPIMTAAQTRSGAGLAVHAPLEPGFAEILTAEARRFLTTLARACGGHGFTAKKPGDLQGALREAFAVDGPAIVDAVVVGDEMPNIPHLELEQIGHYAVAKIKEAVLAVTG